MIDLMQVNASFGIIEPMLIVTGVAILLLIADLLLPHDRKHWSAAIALVGVVWALSRTLPQWGMLQRGYADMVILDNLSTFFNVLFLFSTALVIFLSGSFLRR